MRPCSAGTERVDGRWPRSAAFLKKNTATKLVRHPDRLCLMRQNIWIAVGLHFRSTNTRLIDIPATNWIKHTHILVVVSRVGFLPADVASRSPYFWDCHAFTLLMLRIFCVDQMDRLLNNNTVQQHPHTLSASLTRSCERFKSVSAASPCPSDTAKCKAVSPVMQVWRGSAPWSKSRCTVRSHPLMEA